MNFARQVLSMCEENKTKISTGRPVDFIRPRDNLVFRNNWKLVKDLYQSNATLQAELYSRNADCF